MNISPEITVSGLPDNAAIIVSVCEDDIVNIYHVAKNSTIQLDGEPHQTGDFVARFMQGITDEIITNTFMDDGFGNEIGDLDVVGDTIPGPPEDYALHTIIAMVDNAGIVHIDRPDVPDSDNAKISIASIIHWASPAVPGISSNAICYNWNPEGWHDEKCLS